MKITQLATSGTTPRWAGDYGDRSTLLPGGAKLDAAQFTAGSDGKKAVASGTLVGKKFSESSFGPADAADEQFGFVWADVADAASNNDVELYVSGRVKKNFLPTVPGSTLLAATRIQFFYVEGK